MRTGSLCSGYGGLELALTIMGVPTELRWFSEIDKHASKIMERNYPDVPNLGDLTEIDWAEPVDIVTAGFPCQPVSHAGKRKGIHDERWLIDDVCRIARTVSADWLFLENVSGIYSANKGLAFSRVISALAENGFSAEWLCVPASDVGAPHKRLRWFCLGYSDRVAGTQTRSFFGQPRTLGEQGEVSGVVGSDGSSGGSPAADSDSAGGETRCDSGCSRQCVRKESMGCSSSSSHADRGGHGTREDGGGVGGLDFSNEGSARERERSRAQFGNRSDKDASDANVSGRGEHGRGGAVEEELVSSECVGDDSTFGPYSRAVVRWEYVTGRRAPSPTDDEKRLNPYFVEWMMGLPQGWVCDSIDGRTHQLRILGNGVVPLQAAYAFSILWEQMQTFEEARRD